MLGHTAIPLHRSPAHKLVVVAAGSVSMRVGGRAVDLDGATWTVLPPGVPLEGGDGVSQGLFFWIGLSPERDGGTGLGLLAPDLREAFSQQLSANHGIIRGLGAALRDACVAAFSLVHSGCRDVPLLHGATLTLVGRLREAWALGEDPRVRARSRIAPAVAMAANHPDGAVSLSELAAACRLGHSAFSAMFTTAMGLSPRAWLNRERVRAAARALAKGGTPASVAREYGFPSARHLSRALRQYTGRTLRGWTVSSTGKAGR